MTTPKPFHRAILFSGGGLRFGYYLGMYQALCDNDKQPDVVIASCGGAFVAGLLEVATAKDALNLLTSRDCHQMLCRITPKRPPLPTTYALPAITRFISHQCVQRLKNTPIPTTIFQPKPTHQRLHALNRQSIAYIEQESETQPLWQFGDTQTNISSIILASRLEPTTHQWQVLLRCSHPQLANQLSSLNLVNVMSHYSPQHISPQHWITAAMPLAVAVRASISDMYYLPPLHWQQHTLMGGVINLTPIELACQLACEVFAETKAGYDKYLAEPAISRVFGFSANGRLQDVQRYTHPQGQIHWIDTADNAKHLCPAITKKLRPLHGYLDAKRPDFARFQEIMQAQYQFGYQRTLRLLEN